MARSEVTRRFVRGGVRSLIVEAILVGLLIGLGYGAAAVLERIS